MSRGPNESLNTLLFRSILDLVSIMVNTLDGQARPPICLRAAVGRPPGPVARTPCVSRALNCRRCRPLGPSVVFYLGAFSCPDDLLRHLAPDESD